MTLTGKEFVRRALAAGWIVERISGSHYVLKRDGKTLVVPVHGNRDLPEGLYRKLLKEAGLV